MICECCLSCVAEQQHHKFPQTKLHKRLYPELIHHADNIQWCCADCHVSHASINLTHWSEKKFCEHFGIEPRSKSGKFKKLHVGTYE